MSFNSICLEITREGKHCTYLPFAKKWVFTWLELILNNFLASKAPKNHKIPLNSLCLALKM